MSELRRDPIVGRWVIIDPERGKRPKDFLQAENQVTDPSNCPFCEGHEHMTPSEILSYRSPNTQRDKPGWWIRVFANRFPALHIEGDLRRQGVGMFDMMNGIGAHEIIVETPEHNKAFVDLNESQIEKILWAYRDRMLDLRKDDRFRYILIFKNFGKNAGANISHSHSQLIATPVIPKAVREELDGAKFHYNYKERCIYCDIIRQETSMKERMVEENDHFAAFAPFAARFPFEVCIMPREHSCDYTTITKEQVLDLGKTLKSILRRLDRGLEGPAYNLALHSCPNNLTKETTWDTMSFDFHWHIEIIPRLLKVTGLEWGSGFYINPTPPEDAAAFLRDIEL
ncbi:galactose-1-phosphate uridylyltransferase [bacterium]|nr:galactose-1-phosphate uridylyltransferase [bacterium]